MPKTKRDNLKRLLAQAYINVDWAGRYLHQLANEFETPHPELANILEYANAGLFNVQELLTNFANISWLDNNPDWTGWAGSGRPRHDGTYNDEQLTDDETVESDGNNVSE